MADPLDKNDNDDDLDSREEERGAGQSPVHPKRKKIGLDRATKAALDDLVFLLWEDNRNTELGQALLKYKARWL